MVNRNTKIIISTILLGCLVMAFVDAVLQPGYVMKSMIKIIFFLVIPYLVSLKVKQISFKPLFDFHHKGLRQSFILGIGIFLLILGGYFLVRLFYPFDSITAILISDVGVNQDNFLWVASYIAICNAFLEEFFFRGFAFLLLLPLIGRKKSYLFSSITFALYHVAIMKGWFSPVLFILAILGLMIGGCIFNYLDEKNGTIFQSWMVHMFANLAINTVGMILFGMI